MRLFNRIMFSWLVILAVLVGTLSVWMQICGSSFKEMKKCVTKEANFVLYIPDNWVAVEGLESGYRTLVAADSAGLYEVTLFHGTPPCPGDVKKLAGYFIDQYRHKFPDLRIISSMISKDGNRIVFEGTYRNPARGPREFKSWITLAKGWFSLSKIEAAKDLLSAQKTDLLSILANVRITRGAFGAGGSSVAQPEFMTYRLRDGSASFKIPSGWSCEDFGKGMFTAKDPSGTFSFLSGGAEMITPQMGVNYPGAIISHYRQPHDAWQFLLETLRIASQIQFEEVIPRHDISQQMQRVFTVGSTEAEEFVYTCNVQGQACRGYTFGLTFGSRLGTNWSFKHMTVAAPENQFQAFLPYFETMMQAAYDERQKSMDYIDYQRSNLIRGEQDWISQVEGGTVYHTDSWGTKNTATGVYYEGQPFDYVHFEGENPRYSEQMDPVDFRELWQHYVR